MSWSANAAIQDFTEVEGKLDESFETNYPEAADEVKLQFAAAKDALDTLLLNNPVDSWNGVRISLSGHYQHNDAPNFIQVHVAEEA